MQAQFVAGHDRVLSRFYSLRDAGLRFLRQMSYLPLNLIASAAIPLNLSYRVRLTAAGTIA